ncbi:unnamed protein product [Mycena citricolor]|uniref:Pre-mRNA polyadenylation factor Fip1 domain-containing protein n=1 Tax=Mycena citricolor TaxID=2018698 RepID=A0AAD2JVR5_9AGAR|nr:unnamed protein product [Mycena citricolor]CAK5280672.1 unnamed protein product [Mycena citricolor]
MDDDDDFLYGANPAATSTPTTTAPVTPSTSFTSAPPASALQVFPSQATEVEEEPFPGFLSSAEVHEENDAEQEDEYVDDEQESDEEEDVEIIMEAQSRSLDFRQSNAKLRSQPSSASLRTAPLGPTLTTEYTPTQRPAPSFETPSRGTSEIPPASLSVAPPPAAASAVQTSAPGASVVSATAVSHPDEYGNNVPDVSAAPMDDVDLESLPPVTAPPSHPVIDPTVTGMTEGRSIIDVDLNALADKAWRRPGSDISDWFNYGFDELSWELYCYRRRDLGEMANVLKTNVLNFSGMEEDQMTVLPPEVRQMVMTGTSAMMNGAAGGMGMMMDMGGMMPMGMDMGMSGMMGMPDVAQGGVAPVGGQGEMQDGFNAGMMGMGMEYPQGQVPETPQTQMSQQPMYPQQTEGQDTPPPGPTGSAVVRGGSGGAPAYRGRGARGSRGFPARGRGRGGYEGSPAPARPTSPLPPNVPTGPRNQNKYKDRDGISAAVDGLDYGGGKDGRATASYELDERSRKRRSSPGLDDPRSSKRR